MTGGGRIRPLGEYRGTPSSTLGNAGRRSIFKCVKKGPMGRASVKAFAVRRESVSSSMHKSCGARHHPNRKSELKPSRRECARASGKVEFVPAFHDTHEAPHRRLSTLDRDVIDLWGTDGQLRASLYRRRRAIRHDPGRGHAGFARAPFTHLRNGFRCKLAAVVLQPNPAAPRHAADEGR